MAVCAYCEPEFSDPGPFRVRGREQLPAYHQCPACGTGFDVPDVRLQPEKAPWWRPQVEVFCCPSCQVWLDWRARPLLERSRDWAFMGCFGLYASMSMTNWYARQDWPPVLIALLVLNIGCFIFGLIGNGEMLTRPQRKSNLRPEAGASASLASRLAMGQFSVHGAQVPKEFKDFGYWLRWLLMVGLLVLLVFAGWTSPTKDKPSTIAPDTILMLYAVGTFVMLGAVCWARVLRRRAFRQVAP